jgi:hypothetical protein
MSAVGLQKVVNWAGVGMGTILLVPQCVMMANIEAQIHGQRCPYVNHCGERKGEGLG